MPKTTKGTQLKDPNEKAQLKALFIANKKGIEEAKLEREKMMLGRVQKRKLIILTEWSGDHISLSVHVLSHLKQFSFDFFSVPCP